jgi:hypothetical protein
MHRNSCCRRVLNFSHKTSPVQELSIRLANSSGRLATPTHGVGPGRSELTTRHACFTTHLY